MPNRNPLGAVVNPPRLQPGVGLRGLIMILCAYIWALVGLGVWMGVASNEIDSAFHLAIPAHWRAILWWGSALVAVALAWRPSTSWIALAVLTIMPVVRALSYGWAWIVYIIPGPPPGYPHGWYSVAFHVAMVAVVFLAAVIPDGLTIHGLRQAAFTHGAQEEVDE